MNYIDAMDFLEETKKYGSQLGLTSIQNLMAELGNIKDEIPLVHIGGTNGKGSVGAMLSQVLTEAGYRVGRFCTPDVFVYEDEFLLNDLHCLRLLLHGNYRHLWFDYAAFYSCDLCQ